MLRESLQHLIENPTGEPKECKLGKIIKSQDKETAQILIDVLGSQEVTTAGLIKALKTEGISLSREFLGEKRSQCFKGQDNPNCCLNTAKKEEKSK